MASTMVKKPLNADQRTREARLDPRPTLRARPRWVGAWLGPAGHLSLMPAVRAAHSRHGSLWKALALSPRDGADPQMRLRPAGLSPLSPGCVSLGLLLALLRPGVPWTRSARKAHRAGDTLHSASHCEGTAPVPRRPRTVHREAPHGPLSPGSVTHPEALCAAPGDHTATEVVRRRGGSYHSSPSPSLCSRRPRNKGRSHHPFHYITL